MNGKTLITLVLMMAVAAGAYWFGNQRGKGEAPADGALTIQKAQATDAAAKSSTANKSANDTKPNPRKPVVSASTSSEPPPAEPMVPPQAPFLERFDALKKLADAGDAQATCEMAKTLKVCSGMKEMRLSQANANLQPTEAFEDEEMADYQRKHRESVEKKLMQMEQVCAGLGREHTQQAYHYQQLGAIQGQPEMQRQFLMSPAIDTLPFDRQMEAFQLYRGVAMDMGMEMLERGDASAVNLLNMMTYTGSSFIESDPVQAASVAFLHRALHVDDESDAEERAREEQRLVNRLSIMNELTHEQIEQARQQAQDWKAQYFPDWDDLDEETRNKRLYGADFFGEDDGDDDQLDLTCEPSP